MTSPRTPGPGRRTQAQARAARRSHSTPLAIDLALQGGGSHGAFTWGVLDRLLEDSSIEPSGISGTSAGALNAAVLATGWAVLRRGFVAWMAYWFLRLAGISGRY